MSDLVARYVFLSWLRRGVATEITERETDASPAPRVQVPVRVEFNAGSLATTVPLELLGAGEVSGFDPRAVIRTWPRAEVFDAESNYFPLVEFDQPDLPWRLTPARAEGNDRLRPWLALLAVKEDEGTLSPARGDGTLPTLAITAAAALPDPSQAWAWAHAQVSGDTELSPGELAQLLAQEPWRVTSRIVCPRQLEPRTVYLACLVPALERGRLAGLRLPVEDAVSGIQPAWAAGAPAATLPVYFHWRFRTAEAGDFEALVRRLEPRVLPATVGIRDMDVGDPGGALAGVGAHDAPLGLEGALKAVSTQSTPWPPGATRTRFIDRLKALLNTPAALLGSTTPTRAVTPPLYGRWHAARETLEPGERPPWFQDLNQDPRLRVSAGLGTRVVQQEQRSLMAEAWRQIESIRRINEEFRLAQLARALSERLHVRHVKTATAPEVVELTAPVHHRVMGSPVTIGALLEASPVPDGRARGPAPAREPAARPGGTAPEPAAGHGRGPVHRSAQHRRAPRRSAAGHAERAAHDGRARGNARAHERSAVRVALHAAALARRAGTADRRGHAPRARSRGHRGRRRRGRGRARPGAVRHGRVPRRAPPRADRRAGSAGDRGRSPDGPRGRSAHAGPAGERAAEPVVQADRRAAARGARHGRRPR